VKRPKPLSNAFVHSAALGNVKTHKQGELKWEEEKEAWRGRNVSQNQILALTGRRKSKFMQATF
jgi:hypothetical protein